MVRCDDRIKMSCVPSVYGLTKTNTVESHRDERITNFTNDSIDSVQNYAEAVRTYANRCNCTGLHDHREQFPKDRLNMKGKKVPSRNRNTVLERGYKPLLGKSHYGCDKTNEELSNCLLPFETVAFRKNPFTKSLELYCFCFFDIFSFFSSFCLVNTVTKMAQKQGGEGFGS